VHINAIILEFDLRCVRKYCSSIVRFKGKMVLLSFGAKKSSFDDLMWLVCSIDLVWGMNGLSHLLEFIIWQNWVQFGPKNKGSVWL
jgi:hypothetical protein